MKNIAIVTLAVALENEKGYSRFRTLAEILSKFYNVDIITSTFQHWEKKQRNIEKLQMENINKKYKLRFAYEPGYKTNIDVRRIISHKIATRNIKRILYKNHYDLIYCIIPDNKMAAMVAKYAKKNEIKIIIDVEDLWPEAMQMVLSLPSFLDYILFKSFRKNAKIAYEIADGIIGTSDEYRDIPETKYGIKTQNKKTVYVGCNLKEFDLGIKKFSNEIKKNANEFWVMYAGNLGASYDLETLLRASAKMKSSLKKKEKEIIIKILGGGPKEQELKKLAQQIDANVDFVGYVSYEKMAAYLSKTDVTINSFVKSAPQSIVTKIGDYLASGKPMINTCSSLEFRNKVQSDGFGINVEAENADELSKVILKLYNDKNLCVELGSNARKIAEEQFDRETSYMEIYKMVKKLIS